MPTTSNPVRFKKILATYGQRAEQALDRFLPSASTIPCRLHEAMRYAVLNGGKRVRPVLVYATGEALGIQLATLDAAAASVEFIHAYSLVHDDLPAMDDDDLRRGKPTCHRAFDEATAILAGDALQTLAFETLSTHAPVSDKAKLQMISVLANASGHAGMVGGQAIDLDSVGKPLTLDELQRMHLHKTGALIEASVLLGAFAEKEPNLALIDNLKHYARCIGLAFQVQDDILDVEGDTQVIGKTQGKDIANNKPTYPALLGLDEAKRVAQNLHREAVECLSGLDEKADTLRDLSAYIVQRNK